MFGYVTANYKALSKEDQELYRQHYCGLCRALLHRFGNLSRLTLNNDMTFLLILLSSLYEPEEDARTGRCLTHPLKARPYVCSELCGYCADMTILLAYLKCLDDRMDDKSLRGRAGAAALHKHFRAVQDIYPGKTERITGYIAEINAYEAENGGDIDVPVNLSGKLLGEVFQYRDDAWGEDLRALGEGLGRFIYLMDAYDDLPSDIRRGRYNALRSYQGQTDFNAFAEDSLLMMIAECTQVFETLPLERHLSILRNVLYSGVWMRCRQKKGKAGRAQKTNKETEHEQKSV
ncbi:MAG: DUF5685 family protein [Bacillota bacterium]